jgi:hypothetical protein
LTCPNTRCTQVTHINIRSISYLYNHCGPPPGSIRQLGSAIVSYFRLYSTIQILLIVIPYYPMPISVFFYFCHLAPTLTCQPRSALIDDIRGCFRVHIGPFITIQISLLGIPYYLIKISVLSPFCRLAPALTCQPGIASLATFGDVFRHALDRF